MISVEEARDHILREVRVKSPIQVPVSQSLGMVLAEDIVSDIDSPPHDKSLVDGYAVVVADVAAGKVLKVVGEVAAGDVPIAEVRSGTAVRIMTGAPLPAGATSVIMIEETECAEEETQDYVRIKTDMSTPGRNIMKRAATMRCGEVVLTRGAIIRPMEVGLLSEVGRTSIQVTASSCVAVLSTGNELVPADQKPDAGQIRNSNGPMLVALTKRSGAEPELLPIGRDTREQLRRTIAQGLQQDFLVLSGGVSAGKYDFVPSVLAELGVRKVFHRVNLRPGKPMWFGVFEQANSRCLVFGLPGNPVSSLVCFELFVRPALQTASGRNTVERKTSQARLSSHHRHIGNRPTYFPSVLADIDGQPTVRPLDWLGSADLRTLCQANCLVYFSDRERTYEEGEMVSVYPLN